jgi:hypothetical protein
VGLVGVVGGVLIALGFPLIILAFGLGLSTPIQTTLVILGLLAGVALAGIAAVVGITIPTAISGGGVDIEKLAGCCDDVECKEEADGPTGATGS